jgi:hypothetical protein
LFLELFTFIKTDNNLISSSELSTFSGMSEDVKSALFQRNDTVFINKLFNKDIYDIKVSNYISKTDIQSLVNESSDYKTIETKAIEAFYSELKAKVTNIES